MRKFSETTLVLATHNQGKIHEFEALLTPYVPSFSSSAALGLAEPEETGTSFVENAILKALSAARESGKPALADDSGLSVYALDGAPGIYSARWARPDNDKTADTDTDTDQDQDQGKIPAEDYPMAMAKINNMLGDNPDRRAAFIAVLALAWPDGHTAIFEGRTEGVIIWPPRGDYGFGYDPFFVPDGHNKSFAEMTREEKQAFSHRAKAFTKMQQDLF